MMRVPSRAAARQARILIMPNPNATLALENGRLFRGRSFGCPGTSRAEVVFNTSLTGYQEILTDPSYRGQIVVMTAPQIGNTGVTPEDEESARVWVEGFVVRELTPVTSNWRARGDLDGYLRDRGVVGISEIDTRALTLELREEGALKGVISSEDLAPDELVAMARAVPGMVGRDLVSEVTAPSPFPWSEDAGPWGGPRGERAARRVVAYDFGIKRNILRQLVHHGAHLTVVPATTSAADVLALNPEGVFLSNGPGDPAALTAIIAEVKRLVGRVPVFGICLGHQLAGLALGASSFKLKFGHHGGNHPVRHAATGKVEITTQNHGFAVDPESLPAEAEATHWNLNDGTLEGFRHRGIPLIAVQYHPEAAPGPHDSNYLFGSFFGLMDEFHGNGEPRAASH